MLVSSFDIYVYRYDDLNLAQLKRILNYPGETLEVRNINIYGDWDLLPVDNARARNIHAHHAHR